MKFTENQLKHILFNLGYNEMDIQQKMWWFNLKKWLWFSGVVALASLICAFLFGNYISILSMIFGIVIVNAGRIAFDCSENKKVETIQKEVNRKGKTLMMILVDDCSNSATEHIWHYIGNSDVNFDRNRTEYDGVLKYQ